MNTRNTFPRGKETAVSRKKVIFLDVDGTLLNSSLKPYSKDTNAMSEAARKGHFIFLNTGRSFANIPEALLKLDSLAGISAGCGAHILMALKPENRFKEPQTSLRRFKTIYRKWFPPEELKKIFDLCGKKSPCYIFEGERNCYILNRSLLLFRTEQPVTIHSYDEFAEKSKGDYITKFTLNGTPSKEECLLLESICKVNYFSGYSEGIVKGENKATAMDLILKKLGMRCEDSIAIGDSTNDLDMIRCAGLGIAMGNACDELKAEADAVTGDCGKGGVAKALKKYVLNYDCV